MEEEILRQAMGDSNFRYLLLTELRSINKSLKGIGKCLERIANPPMKLDPNDPDVVKKASQAIKSDRG